MLRGDAAPATGRKVPVADKRSEKSKILAGELYSPVCPELIAGATVVGNPARRLPERPGPA